MSSRALAIAAAIAGVALVLAAARLNAQAALKVDCESYAGFAGRIAEYREVGAPLESVLAYLRGQGTPELVLGAQEREARRVYAEGRDPGEAAYSAFRRCQERLGEMLERGS